MSRVVSRTREATSVAFTTVLSFRYNRYFIVSKFQEKTSKLLTVMFSRLGVRPSSTPRAAGPTTSRMRPNRLTNMTP